MRQGRERGNRGQGAVLRRRDKSDRRRDRDRTMKAGVPVKDLDDVVQRFQTEIAAGERQNQEERQEPADAGAEECRAEALQPAQINLATTVDAVEIIGELAVGPDQLVAEK